MGIEKKGLEKNNKNQYHIVIESIIYYLLSKSDQSVRNGTVKVDDGGYGFGCLQAFLPRHTLTTPSSPFRETLSIAPLSGRVEDYAYGVYVDLSPPSLQIHTQNTLQPVYVYCAYT
ncbi:hypothetical protein M0802_004645 [Mischocyttarus mexicanus]|nr:hypothetical protein M0802_004645 [Mischocyttarus mexicanus]